MVLEAKYAPLTADDVYLAAETLEGVVYRTPLVKSEFLSKLYGCNLSFKLENVQKTGAFKIRGAYNTIASLTKSERQQGLIAASSGNHAQGVAYAAQAFGIANTTTIFMPNSTPRTKIENTQRYGVNIEFVEGNYDLCAEIAHVRAEQLGATYIEPYNDWRIIAGQGTIGLEIMQDAPQTDLILCPVGGGGLISGIALAAHSINRAVHVIGVQARYAQESGYTIADGIRVKHPGDKPMHIIEEHLEKMVKVDEKAIEGAVLAIAQYVRQLVEGSGAVGLAAIMTEAVDIAPDSHVVIVLSGGNIDLMRLQNLVAQS